MTIPRMTTWKSDRSIEGILGGDACRSSVKLSRWGNKAFSTALPFRLLGTLPPQLLLSHLHRTIPSMVHHSLTFLRGVHTLHGVWEPTGTHGSRCYHGVAIMTKASAWRTGTASHISTRAHFHHDCSHTKARSHTLCTSFRPF